MKKIIILVVLILLVLGWKVLKQKDAVIMENVSNVPTDTVPNENIVAENPEGEADPDRMKLDMTTWNWEKTIYSDGKEVKPNVPKKFTLSFNTKDKTFSASTDCNGVGGEYTVAGDRITFDKMMSTLMYCEGSQESEFSKMLTNTDGFLFTSKGELVLTLKYDSGSVYFR